jgi:hypothetical protein
MGLVLVFKMVLLKFDSLMMQEHSISSFWTTVSIIQILQFIFSLQDVLQRNSLMQMVIWTRKLTSSLDTQRTFLLGLLDISRRHFLLQCLVFQSFFPAKVFEHTHHFAIKLDLHMQMQSLISHLMNASLQILFILNVKNCHLVLLMMPIMMMLSIYFLCFMKISF